MQSEKPKPENRKDKIMNLTLASVAAQVGCLTLVIILGAVLGGLWLDNQYDSKPMFTVGLLVASIPISLTIMFIVVKFAVSKIKTKLPEKTENIKEADLGEFK
jgi:MFS-type transporter involved in bile tolerance (Atg22 family)